MGGADCYPTDRRVFPIRKEASFSVAQMDAIRTVAAVRFQGNVNRTIREAVRIGLDYWAAEDAVDAVRSDGVPTVPAATGGDPGGHPPSSAGEPPTGRSERSKR